MTAKWVIGCSALSLLTAQLPACGFTASVDNLLSPPRLTAEQEEIYQVLQNSAGSQISLKYPKSGERLSAAPPDGSARPSGTRPRLGTTRIKLRMGRGVNNYFHERRENSHEHGKPRFLR